MANFQVLDAYGSVITIQSSTFGTAERQIVGASIIGTFPITLGGTVVASLVSTIPSSVLVGASIFGQLPAGTAPIGSVATLQGTNPWVIVGSVYGAGSVVSFQGGAWTASIVGNVGQTGTIISSISGTIEVNSIVGTYAEDATHTTADKGIFTLGVRNDTVASFVSADLEYAPKAVDSAGRTVIKPFAPEQSRIEGTISLTNTSITTVIGAAGAGLKNYITDFWIANSGSVTTLVTFKDGAGSLLGYTIAPATGGSNSPGISMPIRTGANATFDIQATNPTSTLFGTFTGFKAP